MTALIDCYPKVLEIPGRQQEVYMDLASPEDTGQLWAFWQRNVAHFDIGCEVAALDEEKVDTIVQRCIGNINSGSALTYRLRTSEQDSMIGTIQAYRHHADVQAVFLGYYVDQDHIRKGYAYTATHCLKQFIVEYWDVHDFCFEICEGNIPSERVATKLGASALPKELPAVVRNGRQVTMRLWRTPLSLKKKWLTYDD